MHAATRRKPFGASMGSKPSSPERGEIHSFFMVVDLSNLRRQGAFRALLLLSR